MSRRCRGGEEESGMPIILAPLYTPLVITRVVLEEKLKRRMEDLGIAANAETEVLALDKNMATKIFVTVKEDK